MAKTWILLTKILEFFDKWAFSKRLSVFRRNIIKSFFLNGFLKNLENLFDYPEKPNKVESLEISWKINIRSE